MQRFKEFLENRQISIYFSTVAIAAVIGMFVPQTTILEVGINPALALMLFVTFLQVPLTNLRQAFTRIRFFTALLLTNFVIIPLFVAVLVQFLIPNPLILFGVLLVLLTPCIDYVVTFSHLGRADARLLLASTPILLIVQMLLLPVYMGFFLGDNATELIHFTPFVHAFIFLIAIPLILASIVQIWAAQTNTGVWVLSRLGLLPVPATALVLFVVIAAVVPQLEEAMEAVWITVPIYITFAAVSPLIGWLISRFFHLDAPAGRAIAFSSGTRNSLVVLPLALAVPGAIPVLPAIIVTQTLVELVSQLIYVRLIPKLINHELTEVS
ncbi:MULTISPECIES: arsenic resistance protein [Nitrosomonas]|uniref:ACR3 family arsenite efflux pump ArsB n=1 Tax=Nitrosomonas ureae TaxID=44577 RepID=A0A2T5I9Y0_9PROT|nr:MULTISPECIES: arsenic resistance protein [Nitrosomonas]PTQ80621.1 ACR3 family arsenite efflux pump ArsB [Nitrosomonas ureae]PXW83278.1 ACR3 family arsenite efflux pump ArsB [Nitrosomonas sp. Nm84]WMJ10119.1 arsenic resistance protein [Nitrosomonas sp. sh817]